MDSSTTANRGLTLEMFHRAGIDSELATALYETEWNPRNRPVYPDVVETLATLVGTGVRIAVVSDIHFDIRSECERTIGPYVHEYVVSCELGFQKPDPRIFAAALEAVGLNPSEAVMVGDTPTTDGGAAAIGVTTLILPRLRAFGPRGLNVVCRLFDSADRA
jgi:HAD superfamily hydrolase (TIGR01509 family)